MEPELKPCPFCGSSKTIVSPVSPEDGRHTDRQVRCENCGARGPVADDADAALTEWSDCATGWQPIETAPLHAEFLGYIPNAAGAPYRVVHFGGEIYGDPCWVTADLKRCNPTKWHPLPKPPKEDE